MAIGLDSATFDLLKPWIEQGKLPNLSDLVRRGASGTLNSTVPPHTAPAWSSFMTGKNPGKHGVFGFMKLTKDRGHLQLASSKDRKAQDIWEILSQHGRKVVVIRVPLTYPTRPVNGILVSGFMTPRGATDYIYPPELKEEIESAIGGLGGDSPKSSVRMNLELAILKDLNSTLDKFSEGLPEIIRKYAWDFFMVVFQGTDEVQHRFWHLLDPSHPRFDKTKAARYGEAILRYYQRIDQVIGSMVSNVDREETTVILLSDHGAGPLHKWVSLNNLFWRSGLLKFRLDPLTRVKVFLFTIGLSPLTLYHFILKLQLIRVRSFIRNEENRERFRPLFLSLRDVDWSRTKAYALGGWGQVYINRNAIETDYEKVRQTITGLLVGLVDPGSGKQIFRRENIHFREEIYQGPFLSEAPDMLALPDSPYQGYADYEFGFKAVVMSAGPQISGTHAMNGIFIASGADINEGVTLPPSSIVDAAPTILYLMGVRIPKQMDGRVMKEAIAESRLSSDPPQYESDSQVADRSTKPYTAVEEEDLMRRLRQLGYL